MYSTGDYTSAVEVLEKYAGVKGPIGFWVHERAAAGRLFLAIAYHELGREDWAQQTYRETVQWVDRCSPNWAAPLRLMIALLSGFVYWV
jgi:hypothetical protein